MFTIRTMHHSSTSEMQRRVTVKGIACSCGIPRNRQTKIDGHVQANSLCCRWQLKQRRTIPPTAYIERKIVRRAPVAQWIVRWTSNPNIMGTNPT
ncbi:hypothetical protein TNCV_3033901 [Trichonephila clavipes]|nr:hypothetical protein TNCV_3033901 [Trichonephila clavipes]